MFHLNVVRYYTTLFLPIPKEISDKLSIVEGETFAMIVELALDLFGLKISSNSGSFQCLVNQWYRIQILKTLIEHQT